MTDKNKSVVTKVLDDTLNWVDARFPLTSNIKAHLTEYYIGTVGAGATNSDRYFLDDALQARC